MKTLKYFFYGCWFVSAFFGVFLLLSNFMGPVMATKVTVSIFILAGIYIGGRYAKREVDSIASDIRKREEDMYL